LQLEITNCKFDPSFGAAMLLEKDLAVVKLGVARSEVRALSGAGMDGLVALETWQSGSEIVNLT
jgi:hypothetical protein